MGSGDHGIRASTKDSFSMQPASSPHPTKNKSFFNRIQNVAGQQTKTLVSLST